MKVKSSQPNVFREEVSKANIVSVNTLKFQTDV